MADRAFLICIVDDDQAMCESVGSLVRAAGFHAAAFASATAFLESSDIGRAGCLVLDVNMPGLSGLDLQRKLREANNSIPVVFLSGDMRERERETALRQGAIAFLGKPFDGDTLLGAIESGLGRVTNHSAKKIKPH
jgi:FixJ family two-component response regulator